MSQLEKRYHTARYHRFVCWEDQFTDWGLDLDRAFITDAAKVYKRGSWKDRDFDRAASRDLLEAEIGLCNPHLLILLGAAPVRLLCPHLKYGDVVEAGEYIWVRGKQSVVAPFACGNGRSQPNVEGRKALATALIRAAIRH